MASVVHSIKSYLQLEMRKPNLPNYIMPVTTDHSTRLQLLSDYYIFNYFNGAYLTYYSVPHLVAR